MAMTNYPNGFSGGVSVRGVPLVTTPIGSVFYVDSNIGADTGKGTIARPFKTIDYAIGRCTDSKGDVILVFPQHAETVTAAITADVIGISIIGLGYGRDIPVITGNGAIDAMTITAAGVTVQNLEFAAPGTDAQTADINVAAANVALIGTRHIGSTTNKNKVDIITLAATADDCLIDGARIYNSVVEVVGGISIEGTCSRVEVCNCFVFDSIGFTSGAIYDGATALQLYIHHNVFTNIKAATVVMEFGNNSTGVCSFNHIVGRHTTIASNVTAGTGMNFFENRVVEEAALNGAIMPAADAE